MTRFIHHVGPLYFLKRFPRAHVLLKSIRKCLSQHRHIEQPRNPRNAHDAHLLLMANESWRY